MQKTSKTISILLLTLLLFSTSACGATFKGKVIDADSKQPIEGAVVVASWSEERATPAGPTTRLKDVKETLTDKNGMWLIEGAKGGEVGNTKAIFSFLTGTYFTNAPVFIVFKPGYCSWPKGFEIASCKGKIKPAGNDKIAEGETVELPKLTNRDDRSKAVPGLIHADGEKNEEEIIRKQKVFFKLINEELKYLGLAEYRLYREILQEPVK